MIELDLSPIPNQEFMMVLDRQSCVINIYQRAGRVYLDLFMDGEPVQVGSLLQPKAPTITRADCPFKGNFRVVDSQSAPDKQKMPTYEELGTRFKVFYLSEQEEAQVAKY